MYDQIYKRIDDALWKDSGAGASLTMQKKTFLGKEKKALPFVIGTMNMILHGVEASNILLTNTLEEILRVVG